MLRGHMKAAYTIFQNSAVDKVSIIIRGFLQFSVCLRPTPMLEEDDRFPFREWSWLVPAHDADFNKSLTFVLPIRFLLSVAGIFSLSDCTEEPTIVSSYIGSSGRSTISGFGPSRVSRMIFSFTSSANLYCTLHFSQQRGRSGVGLSQMHLSRAVYTCLLTAPCRTLLGFCNDLRCALAEYY